MLFTKDKNAVDLIIAHMDTTVQCIKTAGRAVESYIEGNLSEVADLALEADALASDANHKMVNILNRLSQGSILAPMRENLYLLASSFNRAGDEAASCSMFFLDRRPGIPQPFRAKFIKLAEIAFGGYPEMKNGALNCLKGGWHLGKYCELTSNFGSIRQEMKKIRRDLYRQISEIDDAPWQQVTLETCMTQVTGVCDRMAFTAETITRINLRLGN